MAERTDQSARPDSPEAQPWPEGVIARYLTVGGATVDLRGDEYSESMTCLGCGLMATIYGERRTRELAQSHAETCRAMPRPAVTA